MSIVQSVVSGGEWHWWNLSGRQQPGMSCASSVYDHLWADPSAAGEAYLGLRMGILHHSTAWGDSQSAELTVL